MSADSCEDAQWECPKCTLLVTIKLLRCTLCDTRKPRSICATPDVDLTGETQTPEIQTKKAKFKGKRKKLWEKPKQTNTKAPRITSLNSLTARTKERVNKKLAEKEKAKKLETKKKRGDYSIHDMRRGLWLMVKGASAHAVSRDVDIPHTSLRRNFLKCLGFNHTKHLQIGKHRWSKIEKKISNYEMAEWGGHRRMLLPDEEELIVAACELAAKYCFPWSPSEVIALGWSMMQKIKPGCPCPGKGWLRGFERRWKARLQKCKTSSIDPARAKQASTQVRDEGYNNYVAYHDRLVANGDITAEQLTHMEDFRINIDEIGGDELGKRSKCYQPKRETAEPKWRNIEVGGDHNPFHSSSLYGTIANGTIAPFWTLIHSAPGCKSSRVRADYLEGVPGKAVCWQKCLSIFAWTSLW